MIPDRYNLETEVLGAPLVYPGHPVAIALMITHVFPDLARASNTGPGRFPAAQESSMVGGAGGNVGGALHLLATASEGDGIAVFENPGFYATTDDRQGAGDVALMTKQGQVALDALRERLPAWLASDPAPLQTP